eukprot:SM000029S10502  [mRNA]  locus=s29:570534:577451:+ [translate_table: standard]
MPQSSSSGPMAGVATAAGAAAAEVDRRQYPTMAAEYRLLESVGQGVSATVYKALCIPLGNEVVAVKCLDLERCSGTLDGSRGHGAASWLRFQEAASTETDTYVRYLLIWAVAASLTTLLDCGQVLLMTLQNAPPGLDLERDKRFSKSFKEMIAMCLVKDPTKRPSAEKLLKHSFFKQSKGPEYLARNVLEGLAPLAERVKALKAKDEARLAAKKPQAAPQNEYKRGVSSWNFNVEDLKTQAALMDDDDKFTKIEEGDESAALRSSSRREPDRSAMTASTSLQNLGLEARMRTSPQPVLVPKPVTGNARQAVVASHVAIRSAAVAITRKEPKHIGRFDVFEDDTGESPPEWKAQEVAQRMERQGSDREREVEREREQEREKAREKQKSGPLDPSRISSGPRPQSRSSEGDQERSARPIPIDRSASEHKLVEEGGQQGTALPGMEKPAALQNKDRDSRRSFSGPLNSAAAPAEKRASNGGQAPPASKDGEDRSKGAGAPVVQRKGRFSVTSESMDMNPDASGRKAGVQGSATTSPHVSSSTLPVAAIMPHLQTLMQHASAQQELVFTLMSNLSSGDNPIGLRGVNAPSRDRLRSASVPASQEYLNDMQTVDCERELMLQVTDLQARNSALMEELQKLKLRNVQMERQLNAYSNKEEEARIRREEAAREDDCR